MSFDLSKALRDAAGRLSHAGVPSPDVDARLLASHLLGRDPMQLGMVEVPPVFEAAFVRHFGEMVARRAAREPLQHILGEALFGPLTLKVGPGVFIPRPETEVLADWAVRSLRSNGPDAPVVVDLCTGTGALALYIAHYFPSAQVHAVELSESALTYTRENAHGGGVVVHRGDVTAADTLAELNGEVDMVVTNPPYVPVSSDLDPEVYWDPHMAVFSGESGMDLIEAFIPTLTRLLKTGGLLGIEHDDSTSRQVQDALAASGAFNEIAVLKDLTGRSRFVTARRA